MTDTTRQVIQRIEVDIDRDAGDIPRLIYDVARELSSAARNSVDMRSVAEATTNALIKKGILKEIKVENIGAASNGLIFRTKQNDYVLLGQDGKPRKTFIFPFNQSVDQTSVIANEEGLVMRAGISVGSINMHRDFHRDADKNLDQVTYEKQPPDKGSNTKPYIEHWHREGSNTWVEDQGSAPDKIRKQSVEVDDYGNMRVTRGDMQYLSLPSAREIELDPTGNVLSNCIDSGTKTACMPELDLRWTLRLDHDSAKQVNSAIDALTSDSTMRSAQSMAAAVSALTDLAKQKPEYLNMLVKTIANADYFPLLTMRRTETAIRIAAGAASLDGFGELTQYSKRISQDNLDLGAIALMHLLMTKDLTKDVANETAARTGQIINGVVVNSLQSIDKQTMDKITQWINLLEKPHNITLAVNNLARLTDSDILTAGTLLQARTEQYDSTASPIAKLDKESQRRILAKLARDCLLYTIAVGRRVDSVELQAVFYQRAKALAPDNPDFLELEKLYKQGSGKRV